jgi:lipid A 3-O-deacylase
MRGADLWYLRQECRRPHALEALGRGVTFRWLVMVCMTLSVLGAGSAQAAPSWIDEVKLGVLAHDIRFLSDHVEPGADLNVEILFPSPAVLRVLGAPRPHLGLSLNTAGATDYAYVGLTWSGRPWRSLLTLPEGLFVAGSLGGGIHNGYLYSAPPDRKVLGSRLLFRESGEAGYQLTRSVSLSVMLDHLSNAGLAPHNQGLTNVGARVGVTF